MIDALAKAILVVVEEQRYSAPADDIKGAVKNLVDHYEEWGNIVLRVLNHEHIKALRTIADIGNLGYSRTQVDISICEMIEGLVKSDC